MLPQRTESDIRRYDRDRSSSSPGNIAQYPGTLVCRRCIHIMRKPWKIMEAIFLILIPLAIIKIAFWNANQSRSMLERWASSNHVHLLEAQRAHFLKGPFSFTTSQYQAVFRITAQDGNGSTKRGWARCGGWAWGLFSEKVEVRWDS